MVRGGGVADRSPHEDGLLALGDLGGVDAVDDDRLARPAQFEAEGDVDVAGVVRVDGLETLTQKSSNPSWPALLPCA